MNMPGFAAEASLSKTGGKYRVAGAFGQNGAALSAAVVFPSKNIPIDICALFPWLCNPCRRCYGLSGIARQSCFCVCNGGVPIVVGSRVFCT